MFLSRQKDTVIGKLGNFFENRERRMRGDQTFSMLNDLIPDKIDEFIFIPFLDNLFERCDNEKGYWTFLEEMYPVIEYTSGEAPMVPMTMYRLPRSFLLSFLLERFKLPNRGMYYDLENLPEHSEFLQEEFVFVRVGEDDDEVDLIPIRRLRSRSDKNDGNQEIVGRSYAVEVTQVLANSEAYQDFIEMLDNDRFIYRIQYNLAREYLKRLKAKCVSADASLLDIL